MQDNPIVLGFSAGELSPWLSTRMDLAQYQRGAAHLENFFVEPYGGLRRRTGTRFVAKAPVDDDEDELRLFSFSFSAEENLILEFSPGLVRFFYQGELLRTDDGEVYSLETPWDSAEKISSMRLVQVNDLIFVACPLTPPCELRRQSNTSWTCVEMEFEPLPRYTYLEQSSKLAFTCVNDEDDDSGDTYYDIVSMDGDAIFNSAMEGEEHLILDCRLSAVEYLRSDTATIKYTSGYKSLSMDMVAGTVMYVDDAIVSYYRPYTCIRDWSASYLGDSTDPEDYPYYFERGAIISELGGPVPVCGDWSLWTEGTWSSHYELRRSYDDYSVNEDYNLWDWVTLYSFYQHKEEDRQNWAFSGTEDEPCRMVIYCIMFYDASITSPIVFEVKQTDSEMNLLITQVEDESSARAKLIGDNLDYPLCFECANWSFPAMGVTNGYAQFIGLSQGRLWFGGTATLPTTLIGSVVDDFYNFRMGSDADSAMQLTLASDNQSRICWLNTADGILLGTSEAEWVLKSSDGTGLSSSNASFARQSSVGSENMESNSVENSIFYVQRGGKRIREISYKLESDGFTSTDISLLAEHLFSSGVKEWAVQRGGSTHVWVLLKDHSLAVLTTNAAQQVAAWQRVSFEGGEVLHIAALPSTDDLEDELWLLMKRGGSDGVASTISVEVLTEDEIFLDSYMNIESEDGYVCLEHLAGMDVICHPSDDVDSAQQLHLDADGEADLSGIFDLSEHSNFVIGIPIESQVETMPLEFEQNFNSVSQLGRVSLRLLQSEPNFSYKSSHADEWEYYDCSIDYLSKENYTGRVRISQIPCPGVGQGFCLKTETLRPFNLLALSVERDYHGK